MALNFKYCPVQNRKSPRLMMAEWFTAEMPYGASRVTPAKVKILCVRSCGSRKVGIEMKTTKEMFDAVIAKNADLVEGFDDLYENVNIPEAPDGFKSIAAYKNWVKCTFGGDVSFEVSNLEGVDKETGQTDLFKCSGELNIDIGIDATFSDGFSFFAHLVFGNCDAEDGDYESVYRYGFFVVKGKT